MRGEILGDIRTAVSSFIEHQRLLISLMPLARTNRGENPAQFFLTGVLCFWQVSQVMLDHLKWRYTGHWSIPSSWQWGGREGSMHGMRGLSSFGGSTQCLQRQSCRFWQSVWGCWRSTEVWESRHLMTDFPQSLAFFREGQSSARLSGSQTKQSLRD